MKAPYYRLVLQDRMFHERDRWEPMTWTLGYSYINLKRKKARSTWKLELEKPAPDTLGPYWNYYEFEPLRSLHRSKTRAICYQWVLKQSWSFSMKHFSESRMTPEWDPILHVLWTTLQIGINICSGSYLNTGTGKACAWHVKAVLVFSRVRTPIITASLANDGDLLPIGSERSKERKNFQKSECNPSHYYPANSPFWAYRAIIRLIKGMSALK